MRCLTLAYGLGAVAALTSLAGCSTKATVSERGEKHRGSTSTHNETENRAPAWLVGNWVWEAQDDRMAHIVMELKEDGVCIIQMLPSPSRPGELVVSGRDDGCWSERNGILTLTHSDGKQVAYTYSSRDGGTRLVLTEVNTEGGPAKSPISYRKQQVGAK